ncbi:uncharacterized protein M6B38_304460 [Iris pallida]|uniref:Uncharacterized protein n=1 Tax=Iris pallida TaxID=29817 RepID=A0AAX6HM68_IRIPA|nr:uncharacterized protein M6B38_304460 [Iris pallida]
MALAFDEVYRQDQRSKIDCLLFDLDDTLYPLSTGLASEVLKNIGEYMVEKLGIDRSKISDLCNLLYKNYGTTMSGLRAIGYSFNYDEYHSFVHGRLPYERLKPDPVLRHILLSVPIRKVIFTNADKTHATEALRRLGLEDCFEGIICFETLNQPAEAESSTRDTADFFDIIEHSYRTTPGVELPKTPIICKPSEFAIEHALKIANIDPQRTMFFEDSVRNIQAGKNVGLQTVLIGKSQRVQGADYALESIHNMREALPHLWDQPGKSAERCYSAKLAIQTQLTA